MENRRELGNRKEEGKAKRNREPGTRQGKKARGENRGRAKERKKEFHVWSMHVSKKK